LGQLFQHYQATSRREDARIAATRWAEQLSAESRVMSRPRAAIQWHYAAEAFAWLGESPKSVECASRAVELAPNDGMLRRGLANCLLKNASYEEAIEQLNWCLRRNPRDEGLREQLADAKLSRERAPRTATQSSPASSKKSY
jgi:predicted Zn-dependent protease